MADQTQPQLPPIVTRSEARDAGLRRYFTSAPCQRGHLAERLVSTGHCIACQTLAAIRFRTKFSDAEWAAKTAKWDRRHQQKDPERRAKQKIDAAKRWQARNPGGHARHERERIGRLSYEARLARNETAKAWAKANPEKQRDSHRAWKKKNPNRTLELSRGWYNANKSRVSQQRKAKYPIRKAENPTLFRLRAAVGGALQRAKKAGLKVSDKNNLARAVIEIFQRQGGHCAVCEATDHLELDHIMPLHGLGGTNDPSNLQWLCTPHNRSKGCRHPIEWAVSLGLDPAILWPHISFSTT